MLYRPSSDGHRISIPTPHRRTRSSCRTAEWRGCRKRGPVRPPRRGPAACAPRSPEPTPASPWRRPSRVAATWLSQHYTAPVMLFALIDRHGLPLPARGRPLRGGDRVFVQDHPAHRRRPVGRQDHRQPDRGTGPDAHRHRGGGRDLDDRAGRPRRGPARADKVVRHPLRRRGRHLRRLGGAGHRLGAAQEPGGRAGHHPDRGRCHRPLDPGDDPLSTVPPWRSA